MTEFSLIKETNEQPIPSVWGNTKFHRDPWVVKTSKSEDEESTKPTKTEEEQPGEQSDPDDKKNPDKKSQPDKKPEDPSRQGIIRRVEGAHLVFKKKNDAGTYDELWLFSFNNTYEKGSFKDMVKIKRAILAGTDIPVKDNTSPDGAQTAEQKIIGDAQYLFITGLPQ